MYSNILLTRGSWLFTFRGGFYFRICDLDLSDAYDKLV